MSGSLLAASDVAELLGVPKSWVYEQSRAGRIPTVTLGCYRRYGARPGWKALVASTPWTSMPTSLAGAREEQHDQPSPRAA